MWYVTIRQHYNGIWALFQNPITYRKISQSLKATIFGAYIISLWNLIGISAAVLSNNLPNVSVIELH